MKTFFEKQGISLVEVLKGFRGTRSSWNFGRENQGSRILVKVWFIARVQKFETDVHFSKLTTVDFWRG